MTQPFQAARDFLLPRPAAGVTARRFAEVDIGRVNTSFVGSAVYEFLPKVIAERHVSSSPTSKSTWPSFTGCRNQTQ